MEKRDKKTMSKSLNTLISNSFGISSWGEFESVVPRPPSYKNIVFLQGKNSRCMATFFNTMGNLYDLGRTRNSFLRMKSPSRYKLWSNGPYHCYMANIQNHR